MPGVVCPPELNKPDVNTVWRCVGFSHPVEKTGCMWYMVTVVDKWFGGVTTPSIALYAGADPRPAHRRTRRRDFRFEVCAPIR